jgi:hypothetical protein
LQKNRKEATNFDTEFTKEDPVLTPVNPDITKTIQQVGGQIIACIYPENTASLTDSLPV